MKEKEQLKKITRPIVLWYQENKRMLPWREDKSAYAIWISEIMLQQTKIEAVKSYYARFMKEIPDIQTLANIPEERLLKLWEGLGYYNRARNLKKAAIQIQEEYLGKMPNTYENIVKLAGIGEYTAGAIASIAFKEKIPAVDGNVLRVLSRILASNKDVLLPATKKEMTAILQEIMPEEAGDFNEGLMELGETICIPKGTPFCEKCPVQDYCEARRLNLTEQIPVRIQKVKRKQKKKTVFFLIYQDKIAIQKRKNKGLLGGLYEFPNIDYWIKKSEIDSVLEGWNLEKKNAKIEEFEEKNHIFSHVEWKMKPIMVEVKKANTDFIWVTEKEINTKYAMPTAFTKLIKRKDK